MCHFPSQILKVPLKFYKLIYWNPATEWSELSDMAVYTANIRQPFLLSTLPASPPHKSCFVWEIDSQERSIKWPVFQRFLSACSLTRCAQKLCISKGL